MRYAIAAGLLLASTPTFAAEPPLRTGSHVDLYYSNLDYELSDGSESISIDGDGGGIRFWLGNRVGLFTAELQKNKLDGDVEGFSVDADIRQIRAGLGYRFLAQADRGAWLRAEYINLDTDLDVEDLGSANGETDGFGVHFGGLLGTGLIQGYGEIGFIDLDDEDGMEYRVGLSIQPGQVGGFAEYRKSDLEVDDFDLDEDLEEFRVGLQIAF